MQRRVDIAPALDLRAGRTGALLGWAVATLALGALGQTGCTANQAPQAIAPRGPHVAYVGSRFDLTMRGFDADGDGLQFAFASPGLDIRDRARLVPLANQAIFTWTPLARDVGRRRIQFSVSDGAVTDVAFVTIEVKAAAGAESAPRFIEPSGYGDVLDLAKSKCVRVNVVVEDPDTPAASVSVRQQPTITGSRWTPTGSLSFRFDWCPTIAQQAQRQHRVKLVADDHDNKPVTKDYDILILRPGEKLDGGLNPRDARVADAGADFAGGSTVVSHDFESSRGSLTGTRDWAWGKLAFKSGTGCSTGITPPKTGHSGTGVWGTVVNDCYKPLLNNSDYSSCTNKSRTDDSVLTLRFTLPTRFRSAQLTFWEWTDYFLPFDWAEVYINGAVRSQRCKGNGTSKAWVKRTHSLTGLIGKPVEVKFHFMASGAINYAGWYIDDVTVEGR